MSTTKEQLDTIERSVAVMKKTAAKLTLIKECSKLHKTQEYELQQCEHGIKLGEKILKENGRLK